MSLYYTVEIDQKRESHPFKLEIFLEGDIIIVITYTNQVEHIYIS